MVLKGSVGPGFEISLTTEDGQPVETLAPGSYTLLTDDKSDIHNFHLTGDGVDVSTEVERGRDGQLRHHGHVGHVHVRLRSALEHHERQLRGLRITGHTERGWR